MNGTHITKCSVCKFQKALVVVSDLEPERESGTLSPSQAIEVCLNTWGLPCFTGPFGHEVVDVSKRKRRGQRKGKEGSEKSRRTDLSHDLSANFERDENRFCCRLLSND